MSLRTRAQAKCIYLLDIIEKNEAERLKEAEYDLVNGVEEMSSLSQRFGGMTRPNPHKGQSDIPHLLALSDCKWMLGMCAPEILK